MLTAKNSRKRIEACSPVVAASVGRAAEVIGTSWFADTVRCNGFGNRGSALASPFRSQNPRRRLCRCPRHGRLGNPPKPDDRHRSENRYDCILKHCIRTWVYV